MQTKYLRLYSYVVLMKETQHSSLNVIAKPFNYFCASRWSLKWRSNVDLKNLCKPLTVDHIVS